MQPEGRAQAAERLKGFAGLVVIGGNGSLTGAHLLAQEQGVRVMGIPASIDNDIGCTSTAIGVDSALNIIVEACDRIGDTARSHRRAFIVEVMGRQSAISPWRARWPPAPTACSSASRGAARPRSSRPSPPSCAAAWPTKTSGES